MKKNYTLPKPTIRVEHVSKKFLIPHEKISTLRSAFVSFFKIKKSEVFHALDDVSFTVGKGEFFGVIGRNGSGKSTLLKILAEVYHPNKGTVQIDGKVSPFLELGIGFNPELSGRDNVYLNATVLGMTKKQIDEKFDEIVAFSELERFIDQKLKNYSSGMQVRLAFSVSIHADREVLLMDEVLAVGDALFAAKCMRELHRYRKEKKTVILVSHDLSAIEQYCDRALYLREGKVIAIGDARDVAQKYRDQTAEDSAEASIREEKKTVKEDNKEGDKEIKTSANKLATIDKISFFDPALGERRVFATGNDMVIRVDFREHIGKQAFNVGICIFNDVHQYIFGTNTVIDKKDCSQARARGYFEITCKDIPLYTGTYYLQVALLGESNKIIYDMVNQSPHFQIVSANNYQGIVGIPYEWNV